MQWYILIIGVFDVEEQLIVMYCNIAGSFNVIIWSDKYKAKVFSDVSYPR